MYKKYLYCFILILIMKYEPVSRRGCLNKTRRFIFMGVRLVLMLCYLTVFAYYFCWNFVPWTWNLSKTIRWTKQDDLNTDSYSTFNHIVCCLIWGLLIFVMYLYIFIFAVYGLIFTILCMKGQTREMKVICNAIGMLCRMIGSYMRATVTNESYMQAMVREMGVTIPDDGGFTNADKVTAFMGNHSRGYAERTEQDFNECTICIQEFNSDDNIVELHCKHIFHKQCFEDLLNSNGHKQCPNCRSDVKDCDEEHGH
jgi:hypothetical protein